MFAALHALLARHAESLVVSDEPGNLQLHTRRLGPSGTAMTFGALEIHEDSVSLQLTPVYSHPALLEGLSDDLRERMRGKGSFDFTPQTTTPEILEELSALVDAGLARYRADRLV